MREIKYRGERVDSGEWVYGYLIIHKDGVCEIITSSKREFTHNINGKSFYKMYQRVYHVIPETIGQYIGLKDENDVEVYEDDIVKSESGVHIIKYAKAKFYASGFYNSFQDDPSDLFSENAQYSVIGNIHDNPKLLEV